MMDQFAGSLPQASTRRLHFQHFMREMHARLHRLRHRDRPLDVIAAQIANRTQVLCLDEFQVLDIGDAMILHGLLQATDRGGVWCS